MNPTPTHQIQVVCGTGGVGKTTVSAALAVASALKGKKTLVITIDPAKRLAQALGVDRLSDEPYSLTEKLEEIYGSKIAGKLYALTPDTKLNLEALFRSSAPNPESAERIINNPIFKILGAEFSGANEYMALQKLHEVATQGGYDQIILDTPPSRQALSFLGTPKVLARFFEEEWLKTIALTSSSFVSAGLGKVVGLLEKITGKGFISELFRFTSSLFEMQAALVKKLDEVHKFLHSDYANFTLVTTPHLGALPEARFLSATLQEKNYHFGGVILNRTLSSIAVQESDWKLAENEKEEGFPGRERNLMWITSLQKREARIESLLLDSLPKKSDRPISLTRLPELSEDAHSIKDLLELAKRL